MNDVMQGRWTLLHVIGLVVWQKHVKSLSLLVKSLCWLAPSPKSMNDE